MGDARKLDLSFQRICDIARSLNQNILDNKRRTKENKIPTDHYITQTFNVSRKNFNFTAKEYGVQFDRTTGLYEIPAEVNKINTKVNAYKVNNGSKEVNQVQVLKNNDVNNTNTKSIPIKDKDIDQSTPSSDESLPTNIHEISEQLNKILSNEILSLTDNVKEMLEWYEAHKDKKILEDTEINLNNDKLSGEVVTRSYKVYKTVSEEFSQFAADRKESIKDLISLALVEFVEKYKK